ncbi:MULTISPECIES: phasin family protein [unclassified Janthinobacterium]
MEVQLAFMTDLFRKAIDTAQKVTELNMRLAQELIEDMTSANRHLMATKDATEFASVATTQLHPSIAKLRNYQQRLSNVLANANVEMTKTAESHMPAASRAAAAVADEIVRAASEETDKATQRQRAAIDQMNEAARRGANGMEQQHNRGLGQETGRGTGHGQQAH